MPVSPATLFEHRPAELEVILTEPEHGFRWFEHDYPMNWHAGTTTLNSKST